jgi:RNA polymerase sigma-70 factor (ECF subfamily)
VLARVADGDREALRILYERNAGWLTVRLQRRCPDPELVDTALQDTFLAVWRGASGFRGEGEVGAWLWGIAVRKLIDQLRRRRPVPVEPLSAGAPPAHTPSAEHEALGGDVGGELGEAFRRLTPELQAVLLATAVDGLSTKEAAVLLGVPQGTVKTRLMRARAQIQERFA